MTKFGRVIKAKHVRMSDLLMVNGEWLPIEDISDFEVVRITVKGGGWEDFSPNERVMVMR